MIIETGIPLYATYDTLDSKLHKGFVSFIKEDIFEIISLIWTILYLIGIGSLYFLKPIGRSLFLISFIILYVFTTLSGDDIYYGLTSIINDLTIFLDFFILYLIYLSPFKKEFEKQS